MFGNIVKRMLMVYKIQTRWMNHLLKHKQDNIQSKLSNRIWQKINFFRKPDWNGHAANAQLIYKHVSAGVASNYLSYSSPVYLCVIKKVVTKWFKGIH